MTNIVLSNTNYNVVGTRPIRHDGADKVTGRAKYGADFEMSGMLYGKVLRSPHAHARIKSIDTSAAEALPGVRAVVTGADLPIAGKDNPPMSAPRRQRQHPRRRQGSFPRPPYRRRGCRLRARRRGSCRPHQG